MPRTPSRPKPTATSGSRAVHGKTTAVRNSAPTPSTTTPSTPAPSTYVSAEPEVVHPGLPSRRSPRKHSRPNVSEETGGSVVTVRGRSEVNKRLRTSSRVIEQPPDNASQTGTVIGGDTGDTSEHRLSDGEADDFEFVGSNTSGHGINSNDVAELMDVEAEEDLDGHSGSGSVVDEAEDAGDVISDAGEAVDSAASDVVDDTQEDAVVVSNPTDRAKVRFVGAGDQNEPDVVQAPSTPLSQIRSAPRLSDDTPRTPVNTRRVVGNSESPSPTAHRSSVVDTPTVNRVNRLNFATGSTDKVTSLTRSYFNAEIITRVNRLLDYNDDANHCYAARHIPTTASLGPSMGAADNRSNYVCIGDDPMTLWLVSEVISFIHTDASNNNYGSRRVAITFRPFFRSDYEAVRRMIMRTSNPNQCGTADDSTQSLVARRWMGEFGMSPEEVPRFTECYNATRGWQGAIEGAEYMNPADISANDIVVVEANVLKVIPTETVKTGKREYKRKIKGQWETELEVLSVGLIFKAPKYTPKRRTAAVAI